MADPGLNQPFDPVDEWGRASFPASDPPSTWSGRDDPGADDRHEAARREADPDPGAGAGAAP